MVALSPFLKRRVKQSFCKLFLNKDFLILFKIDVTGPLNGFNRDREACVSVQKRCPSLLSIFPASSLPSLSELNVLVHIRQASLSCVMSISCSYPATIHRYSGNILQLWSV
ncbi:hypothetical protein XELAEV_18011928mg [Xenopus laevis]|uniref:Uncharacterized protein n=1 Tax=Xenopus laevis TaxID=8355 RepID=A0A974DN54_XENLA|nr:hypothetical protein XELAEV_18011928mg [Xenopus laevis]